MMIPHLILLSASRRCPFHCFISSIGLLACQERNSEEKEGKFVSFPRCRTTMPLPFPDIQNMRSSSLLNPEYVVRRMGPVLQFCYLHTLGQGPTSHPKLKSLILFSGAV